MQQCAQAAKGLIASLSKDFKELNLRLPDVLAPQFPAQQPDRKLQEAGASGDHRAALRTSAPIDERVARFKDELLASRIDMQRLRALAFSGIPDRDGLRAITWKVRGGATS